MAVRLRLMRIGKTKQPSYRVVAKEARTPRSGKYIEQVGFYNPLSKPATVEFDADRLKHWLDCGAPALAERVRAAAAAEGESPGRFARAAVAAFDRDADAAAWTRLTGRLHGAEDPGLVCLEEMVRWRLAALRSQPMEKA